jgi:hypothetical protein
MISEKVHELKGISDQLRSTLVARIPAGEAVAAVQAADDKKGVVALTGTSLIWVRESWEYVRGRASLDP